MCACMPKVTIQRFATTNVALALSEVHTYVACECLRLQRMQYCILINAPHATCNNGCMHIAP